MKPLTYAILFALLPAIATAQNKGDKAAGNLGKADLGKAPAARAALSTAESGFSNSMRQVLAREFIIFPGATAYFEWLTDLSGSDHVSISVTTLSEPSSRLTNVRIGVAFAAPGDWYVLTDVILGSDFFYYDHGGATVPIYGPLMKLAVTNDGGSAVKITQLAAYAVAR